MIVSPQRHIKLCENLMYVISEKCMIFFLRIMDNFFLLRSRRNNETLKYEDELYTFNDISSEL